MVGRVTKCMPQVKSQIIRIKILNMEIQLRVGDHMNIQGIDFKSNSSPNRCSRFTNKEFIQYLLGVQDVVHQVTWQLVAKVPR